MSYGITQGARQAGALRRATVTAAAALRGLSFEPRNGLQRGCGAGGYGRHGVGATVNVTSIGDTPLAAVQAVRFGCRYGGVPGHVRRESRPIAIAGFAQASPTPMMTFTPRATPTRLRAAGNVFSTLKVFAYDNRPSGSTLPTQNGAFPNNIYAVAAAMA